MLDIKNTKGVTSRKFKQTHKFTHLSFIMDFHLFLKMNFSSSPHHSSLHGQTPFMPPLFYLNRFCKQWFRIMMWKYQEKPAEYSHVILTYWWNFLLPQSNLRQNIPLGKWYSILIDFHKIFFSWGTWRSSQWNKIECFKTILCIGKAGFKLLTLMLREWLLYSPIPLSFRIAQFSLFLKLIPTQIDFNKKYLNKVG